MQACCVQVRVQGNPGPRSRTATRNRNHGFPLFQEWRPEPEPLDPPFQTWLHQTVAFAIANEVCSRRKRRERKICHFIRIHCRKRIHNSLFEFWWLKFASEFSVGERQGIAQTGAFPSCQWINVNTFLCDILGPAYFCRNQNISANFFCENPSGHGCPSPKTKSWTSAPKSAFSCGRGDREKLFDPRHPGVRVGNVRGKSGPINLYLRGWWWLKPLQGIFMWDPGGRIGCGRLNDRQGRNRGIREQRSYERSAATSQLSVRQFFWHF